MDGKRDECPCREIRDRDDRHCRNEPGDALLPAFCKTHCDPISGFALAADIQTGYGFGVMIEAREGHIRPAITRDGIGCIPAQVGSNPLEIIKKTLDLEGFLGYIGKSNYRTHNGLTSSVCF
tara:strand:+ start:1425 stop:1790 length:366 start_codon:yes stop_codon:yes gene_type:complete